MAVDSFLDFQQCKKAPKIEGETQDTMFPKCMHIVNYDFTVNQKGTSATGTGLGAGKAEFDDFTFTKATDMASPQLLKHCAAGTHFDQIFLHVRKAGGTQVEFLTIRFDNVLISSFQQNGEEESTETVKFNYQGLFVEYRPQKDDGSLGSPSKGGWDLKKNGELTA